MFGFGVGPVLRIDGGRPLDEPIVGMAAAPGGTGYWEVASDGGSSASVRPGSTDRWGPCSTTHRGHGLTEACLPF